MDKKPKITTRQWVTLGIVLPLYLLFLYWVESWWGLLLVPFIIDFYTTRFIDWYWWRKSSSGVVRTLMGWVDAIGRSSVLSPACHRSPACALIFGAALR